MTEPERPADPDAAEPEAMTRRVIAKEDGRYLIAYEFGDRAERA